MSKPRVAILTMGGTIASTGAAPDATTIYELDAARNPVQELLPILSGVADIVVEAFAHLASHDIPIATVLDLARRIAAIRARNEADGIVVTHGTDTLEETAYFLDLLLPAGAPVVVTGAARPASALSADGPLNLLNAVRVATSAEAADQGVLVCMNDRLSAARFVTKAHATATDAFGAAEQGHVGAVAGGEIAFFNRPRNGTRPRFDPHAPGELPHVDIIHCHLGMSPALVDHAIADGAAGLVFASTGNGSIPAAVKPSLTTARAAGVVVVRSSRVGSGAVTSAKVDDEYGTIPAGSLNPQKARLLLMLALRETRDRDHIAAMFRRA
ncbi:MAG: asparaginase [Alphaproteobacteria bacterium]|nr:asparaginase [Alphaproteobacteria bacterium]